MKIDQIRAANLRRLAKNSNNQTEFAKQLGISSPYLTHMIGPTPYRVVSEKGARKFEKLLNLPFGALDIPVDGTTPSYISKFELNNIIKRLGEELGPETKVSATKFAMLLTLALDQPEKIKQLIALMLE
ncbi:MAG: hypothetical protein WCG50_15690 [Rhodoferax sp.]|uniref:hypothetical protein n=1 Tax=Rhodoferax sp. TaxID=50421 RepID=UPI00301A1DC3